MNGQNSEKLISVRAADLLIARRDGDMTLLYLYLCRTGCTDREKAQIDLFMPRQRLNEAFERLEMCGLLEENPLPAGEPQEPPSVTGLAGDARCQLPFQGNRGPQLRVEAGSGSAKEVSSPELPEYSAEDVRIRSEKDSAFSAVLTEARLIMGRALSTPDLIKMLGIYDHLDLPADVMMELMHYVADVYREKYGESRRPTAHAFEREAQVWAEKNITDFDAAENYIRLCRERKGLEGRIKEAMDIHDRDFTDTERRYIAQWLDLGFGPDEIHLAYDRAVTKTGKRAMAYMNGILQNWHEKNLHNMREIQDKDRPASHTGRPAQSAAAQTIDMEQLGKIEQLMKGAGK